MALLITILLGFFFLVGIFIVKIFPNKEKIESVSICVALGALTALLFFDLLPEVIEGWSAVHWWTLLFVAIGIGILKLLDLFIPEQHDSHLKAEEDDHGETIVHIGIMTAIAIIIHNVIEGMSVYSMSVDSVSRGIALAIGVGLHNIPMGMLIYASLKHEKMVKRYLFLGFTTFSTFIGGLLMYFLMGHFTETSLVWLLDITMGMVIYIAFFELLPSFIRSKKRLPEVLSVIIGFVVVAGSTFLG